MTSPKDKETAAKNQPQKQKKKEQTGDPDNRSETTGATESGEEDVGAKE